MLVYISLTKKLAKKLDKLEEFFKSFGILITKYRKQKNYSLEELGLQIGIDRSAMHRIENGKPITLTTVIKLCIALNKRPSDFFNEIAFDFQSYELGSLVNSKKSPDKKVISSKKSLK